MIKYLWNNTATCVLVINISLVWLPKTGVIEFSDGTNMLLLFLLPFLLLLVRIDFLDKKIDKIPVIHVFKAPEDGGAEIKGFFDDWEKRKVHIRPEPEDGPPTSRTK